jgi:hypothetical protein
MNLKNPAPVFIGFAILAVAGAVLPGSVQHRGPSRVWAPEISRHAIPLESDSAPSVDNGQSRSITDLEAVTGDRVPGREGEFVPERTDDAKLAASARWQSLFGDIDFTRRPLFNSMTYVHPRPDSDFKPFFGVTLSPSARLHHVRWSKEIFKGGILERLVAESPSGYYLHKTEDHGTGLLSFDFHDEQRLITIHENGVVFLVTVRPHEHNGKDGVSRRELAGFLDQRLNFGDRVDAFIEGLSLPARMPEGFIFRAFRVPRGFPFRSAGGWRG